MGYDGTTTGKLLVSYVKWECRGRGDEPCLSLLVQTPSDARKLLHRPHPSLPDEFVLRHSARLHVGMSSNYSEPDPWHCSPGIYFSFFKKYTSPASVGKGQDATLYLSALHGVGTQGECSCPL